ncbi:putative F-box protein At1g53360 [Capsella rubella]|uniref:putative F-box protein At1g53360 n=1 Tax=Capsella rubella TaxID=81985 RepID=UPI000CD5054C|nr:putative F-box protein At1g53360 [Capsella rubella]
MKNHKRCRRKKQKKQQFSDNLLIPTQSSSSVREYSNPIPVDVLVDIFSRVSARSIARFSCVSKLWESIFDRPYFTELFLTKSFARPRLLFTFKAKKELCVLSSPQPQNPHENSTLVATLYKCYPKYLPFSSSHHGLVYLRHWQRKVRMIFNPVTGESITLPSVKGTVDGDCFFGYDPISRQYKVLCMTRSRSRTPNTHQILTLETGNLLWKTIQDPGLPHYPMYGRICINGVLYYTAYFSGGSFEIVCFDFRFEKFSVVKLDIDMDPNNRNLTLFNYKGKLGAHQYIESVCKENLKLWVLEDSGKHVWSKRVFILPSIVYENKFVGMTGTGEIVFSPDAYYLSKPFYIFFYNIERQTYTRVRIHGFEEFMDHSTFVQTSIDFVEDMKFI